MKAKLMLVALLVMGVMGGASWFAAPAGAQAAGGEMDQDVAAGGPIATCSYPAWVAATAAAISAASKFLGPSDPGEGGVIELPEAVLD